MTYKGVARGRTIELEEALPYPEGEPVRVSVEPLDADRVPGSPEAILRVMRSLHPVSQEDIDALERAIAEGQLPPSEGGIFDEA